MLKFSSRLQFSFRTLYQILNVPENASQAQIKSNYLKIVKIYHPDTNSQQSKDQEYFKQVTAAYTILSNESDRRMYDQKLKKSDQKEYNNYQQNQEENNQKEPYQNNQYHNQSQQNYQKNNSQEQNEQIQSYISLVVFFFLAWLSQQNKQKQEQNKEKQAINLIPNKFNPAQAVYNEKKQLSEQDCKDLPLDIIQYKSKQGDYIMGQLCYDRLIFDEKKILKKKKDLDDDFQQVVVNDSNSQISQKSETILVDQVQQHQLQSETQKKEIFQQNLESKEQLEEIKENDENKQNEQQKNNEISDVQTLKDVNIDQFENNSEQCVFKQKDQEEQFQQQTQQENQKEN